MKKRTKLFRLIGFNFSLVTITLFSSCETYHFAYPLPVDSKNIYKTPKKLRGFVGEDIKEKDGYFFEKHSIKSMDRDTLKIIKGIWFSPRDTSHISKSDTASWKKLNALPSYNSLYSLKFDSLKKLPTDTIQNYIIKGDKVYAIYNTRLDEGSSFIVKNDTICIPPKWHQLELGQFIFFRKVASDVYLLNIRDGILDNDYGPWWQIFLITKRKNEKVFLYDWDSEIQKDPSFIYSGSDHNYFDSRWTRKDILKLIKDGMFEPLNDD